MRLLTMIAALLSISCSAVISVPDKQPGTDTSEDAEIDAIDTVGDAFSDGECDGEPMLMGVPVVLWSGETNIYMQLRWTGSEFGRFWYDGVLFVATHDANGAQIRSASEVVIPGYTPEGIRPAWMGSTFGGLWVDDSTGTDQLMFTRVSEEGTGDVPVSISSPSTPIIGARSTYWTGSELGVAWHCGPTDSSQICFAKSDTLSTFTAGTALTTEAVGLSAHSVPLAFSGSEWGVTWVDARHAPEGEIYFARLSGDGSLEGEARVSETSDNSVCPDIVWAASEYIIVWTDYTGGGPELQFARLQPDGVLSEPVFAITNSGAYSGCPVLAWTGSSLGLTWREKIDDIDDDVYFLLIDALGNQMSSEVQVSQAPGESRGPFINWTGSEFVINWNDYRTGIYWEALFARVGFCE